VNKGEWKTTLAAAGILSAVVFLVWRNMKLNAPDESVPKFKPGVL